MTQHDTTTSALDKRYGDQPRPDNLIWTKEVETILRHKSVRAYLPDPLPEGALETIVAAAQSASTSSNLNQWSVIAVADPTLKSHIGELARMNAIGMGQPYIDEAPVVLLWVADMSRNHAISTQAGGNPEVLEFTDSFLTASVDAALAAQNAAIAAESMGLGIVYIGALRNKAQEVADLIHLPDHSYVVFGMVIGHPDPAREPNIRPRPAQRVVLHHDTYDEKMATEALATYEPTLQQFRKDSGMKSKTWYDTVRFSSEDPAKMDGREQLRQTLNNRGFKLR